MRFFFAGFLPSIFKAFDEQASLMQATKVQTMITQQYRSGHHDVHTHGENAHRLAQMTQKIEKECREQVMAGTARQPSLPFGLLQTETAVDITQLAKKKGRRSSGRRRKAKTKSVDKTTTAAPTTTTTTSTTTTSTAADTTTTAADTTTTAADTTTTAADTTTSTSTSKSTSTSTAPVFQIVADEPEQVAAAAAEAVAPSSESETTTMPGSTSTSTASESETTMLGSTSLTSILDLMQAIAEQVQAEHTEDDNQAVILQDAIEKCNENGIAEYSNSSHGVAFYQNVVDDAEQDHATCRNQETDDYENMVEKCDDYEDGADAARDSKNHCDCNWNATTSNDAVVKCVEKQRDWAKKYVAELKNLKHLCTNATENYSDTQDDCDEKQATYESDFCAYAAKKSDVCSNLETCRQDAIDQFSQVCDEIEIVAETRKAVWTSIEKIQCYVDVMLTAEQQNITQTEVNVCIAMVVNTTHLDFARPAIPPATSCTSVESRPGQDVWADMYDSEWTGLEDITACVMPE